MLAAYDKFVARINQRYAEARKCLEEDRYEDAQTILADLALSHAKTSLSLRNVLVKDGKIKEK